MGCDGLPDFCPVTPGAHITWPTARSQKRPHPGPSHRIRSSPDRTAGHDPQDGRGKRQRRQDRCRRRRRDRLYGPCHWGSAPGGESKEGCGRETQGGFERFCRRSFYRPAAADRNTARFSRGLSGSPPAETALAFRRCGFGRRESVNRCQPEKRDEFMRPQGSPERSS